MQGDLLGMVVENSSVQTRGLTGERVVCLLLETEVTTADSGV